MATAFFNPEQWLQAFRIASSAGDRGTLSQLRIAIQQQTISVVQAAGFDLSSGEHVKLPSREQISLQVRQSKFYGDKETWKTVQKDVHPPHVLCSKGDCLEAVEWQQSRGLNTVILNMANAYVPGGGYKHGSGAQEENLHRRSNYYQFLEDPEHLWRDRPWKYPIPEQGGIYSPDVTVFRKAEDKGYAFMSKPYTVSMIAVAAFDRPQLMKKGDEILMSDEIALKTMGKIRTVLRIAYENGHNAIVLSALGCGAFQNPPKQVARLFKQVIEEDFNGAFQEILFAIVDDHNSRRPHNPQGNFKPFVDTFGEVSDATEQCAQFASML